MKVFAFLPGGEMENTRWLLAVTVVHADCYCGDCHKKIKEMYRRLSYTWSEFGSTILAPLTVSIV